MLMTELKIGSIKTLQKTITSEDIASSDDGEGLLKNVIATPTLAALMIEAAVSSIDAQLPDGYLTIGKSFTINHNNTTLDGMTVTLEAVLININEDKLFFEINAYDGIGKIGAGKHERAIVNYGTLINKVNETCSFMQGKLS